MKWVNLKEIKCPRCSEKLTETSVGYKCPSSCGFTISHENFASVINRMYTPTPREEMMEERRQRWLAEL